MASSSSFHFILFCSLFIAASTLSSVATTSFRPKGLLLPVTKDASTQQYLTRINQRTPQVPLTLTVDLGGHLSWADCEKGFVSSTYRPARCNSAQCKVAWDTVCPNCPVKPDCINNTCGIAPTNTVNGLAGGSGQLGADVVSIQSNDGRAVSLSNFLFICTSTSVLQGLASSSKGMACLGMNKVTLPYQLATAFRFPRKFAICLSSSTISKGVILFGDGPYMFLPNVDVSNSLIYTPLIPTSAPYVIGVKSILINQKVVPIDPGLISGYNEIQTQISTVDPYTLMHTSIYNAFIEVFIKEFPSATRVASVAPFGACFSSKSISSTRAGPAVPHIDLVLQNKNVYWRIFGANSMVRVSNEVLCLGFVDAGTETGSLMVLGGHQIEDNFLQFDLKANRLGFSSSLLFRQTTCANFNFTSHL
ncbi:probable aspartic proteinase GIP2 [Cornus florida]|uniref:probable aspartic proteinase GIP2 n=1 Tax=Cornus florida TaxID=4283 RepID=UPI002898C332|nr:probable aspartic proteinase GIP2 [Cornus florida]